MERVQEVPTQVKPTDNPPEVSGVAVVEPPEATPPEELQTLPCKPLDLDEILRHPPEPCPKWEGPEPTWEMLVECEPALAELRAEAQRLCNPRQASSIWYGYGTYQDRGLKARVVQLVGWGASRKDALLMDECSYNLAYETIYDELAKRKRSDGYPRFEPLIVTSADWEYSAVLCEVCKKPSILTKQGFKEGQIPLIVKYDQEYRGERAYANKIIICHKGPCDECSDRIYPWHDLHEFFELAVIPGWLKAQGIEKLWREKTGLFGIWYEADE